MADKGPLYCQDLYNQWRMLDFRGIMHINMDSRINIPLQEIFVVPDVVHLVPEFETLEREETSRTPGIKPSSKHDYRQHDKNRSKEGRESFLHVLATSTSRSIVILGDPGAGKTTLLRYLLLQLTDVKHQYPTKLQALSKLKNFLPLYIPLAAFASAYYTHGVCTLEDFLPFLLQDYALDDYTELLEAKIKRKQVLFLLDGLDELANTGLRRMVVDELMRFTRVHAENYFLVTSRIVGYKNTPLDLPYQPYTIVDFGKEQIRESLHKTGIQPMNTG
jgi:predicted NACHT family NTPase